MVTPASNRQTRLIMILIIFLGFVVGYFYYNSFTNSNIGIKSISEDSKDTLSQFKDLKFDFQVFNSPSLKTLKIFGEVPVVPDKTGKINPFTNF